MINRRELIGVAGLALMAGGCSRRQRAANDPLLVNDVHSMLNPTRVASIVTPTSNEELAAAVRTASDSERAICIAGARHAMGGQQFAADAVLIDARHMNRVIRLDAERGLVNVEAGIQWPALIKHLVETQQGRTRQWGIRQKQSGADRLCLGGALSANVHGRGLMMKPLIDDVEEFTLIDASGSRRRCSREDNSDLFRLAIGGYGLFGVIDTVTLRLAPRRKVRRVVEILEIDSLMAAFQERIDTGFLYGDFQFAIDEASPDYLRKGVFSCYQPAPDDAPMDEVPERASEADWLNVVTLAHRDKARAYDIYTQAYLSTNGKVYWSDTHQLGAYVQGYHPQVDRRLKAKDAASEIITEIYVPRHELIGFMEDAAADFRHSQVNLIYGTIRLVEKDEESFLAWATQPWVCVIFNLHTEHTEEGQRRSADAFRRLIDVAISHNGSYYLTYHRYATRDQVQACYPQFQEFLRQKRHHDPQERFQSDWYRHYRAVFA